MVEDGAAAMETDKKREVLDFVAYKGVQVINSSEVKQFL